jgi:hypothetical protein
VFGAGVGSVCNEIPTSIGPDSTVPLIPGFPVTRVAAAMWFPGPFALFTFFAGVDTAELTAVNDGFAVPTCWPSTCGDWETIPVLVFWLTCGA